MPDGPKHLRNLVFWADLGGCEAPFISNPEILVTIFYNNQLLYVWLFALKGVTVHLFGR